MTRTRKIDYYTTLSTTIEVGKASPHNEPIEIEDWCIRDCQYTRLITNVDWSNFIFIRDIQISHVSICVSSKGQMDAQLFNTGMSLFYPLITPKQTIKILLDNTAHVPPGYTKGELFTVSFTLIGTDPSEKSWQWQE